MTVQELLFYAYFAIMLAIKGFGLTAGPVYQAGFLLASLLAVLKILLSTYTKKEAGLVFGLLALTGVSFLQTGDYSVIIYSLLILSLKGIRQERVMKLAATVWTPVFLFQILTQLLNLRTRDFVVHSKYHLGYAVRWALGYTHPNVLQITYVVTLSYLLYCLHGERLKAGKFLLLMLASAFGAAYFFLYSLSLTGMIGYLAFALALLYFEWKRRKNRLITKSESFLLQCLLPLEIFGAIVLPLILRGKAFDLLNRAMTTRPMLTREFLTVFGVRLLGSRKPEGASFTMTLDSSYAELLFYGGILIFALMMAGYLYLIGRSLKETPSWHHSVKMAVIFFCLAAAVSEPFAFNTSFKNVSLIFLGCELLRKKEGENFCLFGGLAAGIGKHQFHLWNPCAAAANLLAVFRNGWRSNGRRAATAAVLAMAAAAILYGNLAVRQDAYYCRRRSTDVPDGEMQELYLSKVEIQKLEETPGIRVLNYLDEKDPMFCFRGKITEYDYLRGAVSVAFWSGAAAGILASGAAGICAKRAVRRGSVK